ncbi:MAG TPA: inositol monophosphatase family protein [Rhodobacteraceae bacterium]|nr:inositol monophosphatase family protein [Paracoccaceae bacterium]
MSQTSALSRPRHFVDFGVILPDITDTALRAYAEKIAEDAGKVAMSYFRGKLGIEVKEDLSPVTVADKAVEAFVRERLAQDFPDDGVFGEEEGASGLDRARVWVLDPIDGTRSFLSGYPTFGFLLAILEHGKPKIGVVGIPAMGEVYTGLGREAQLNGAPISVSQQKSLSDAILYIHEAEHMRTHDQAVLEQLTKSGTTRRFAYDCYAHALLAAGHIDAVVDYNLQPYDYLPLCALIEAAGGLITDWQGQPLTLESDGRVISAATPELHAELLEITK